MAEPRKLSQLREEAYRKADCLGAEDRHPQETVDRDLNQGAAEFWDEIIGAYGAGYVRAGTPITITTTANTTSYALSSAFYVLIGVRIDGDAGTGPLVPFDDHEEAILRAPSSSVTYPTHYQIRRSVQQADGDANTVTGYASQSITLLPLHAANKSVIVEYAPRCPEMTEEEDTLDGINGWEDYAVTYAAREMASRDDEDMAYSKLDKRLAEMRDRIRRMAPKRDLHRARRPKDIRGPMQRRRRYPPA